MEADQRTETPIETQLFVVKVKPVQPPHMYWADKVCSDGYMIMQNFCIQFGSQIITYTENFNSFLLAFLIRMF